LIVAISAHETLDEGEHALQQRALNHTFTNFSASSAPYTQQKNRSPRNIEPWNPFYQNTNAGTSPRSYSNNHSSYWPAPKTFLSSYSADQRTCNVQFFNDRAGAFIEQDDVIMDNNMQHNPFLRSRDMEMRKQEVGQIPARTKRSGYSVNAEVGDYSNFPGS